MMFASCTIFLQVVYVCDMWFALTSCKSDTSAFWMFYANIEVGYTLTCMLRDTKGIFEK